MSTTSTNNPSTSSGQATSMAELMAKMGNIPSQFVAPKKGQQLKGTVIRLHPSEIAIDIHAKSEAIVLEKDPRILKSLLSNLKLGQEVTVGVLNAESDTGHPVVSLRYFIEDILWKELDDIVASNRMLQARITDVTRGGFLVDAQMGFSGFLPNSQIIFPLPTTQEQQQNTIGTSIAVYILEHQRDTKKIIFTQKKTMDTKAFEEAVAGLKIGDRVQAIISGVTSFGIFIAIKDRINLDALVHISEISWEGVNDVGSLFTIGEEIEAVVVGFNKEAKRVELSIKKLTEDPFTKAVSSLGVDQKVEGVVKNVDETGVHLNVISGEEELSALIRKEKVPVGAEYIAGQELTVTISQIDTRRRIVYVVPVMLRKTVGYR